MHTTTTTTTTQRLIALVEGDAPAKVRKPRQQRPVEHPDETVFRVPDFHEGGFAVFIGEDAAVLVEERAMRDIDLRLTRGSILARTGHFPSELGIVVQPHSGVLSSPTFGAKHHEAQVAWSLAHHTLVDA